MLAAKPDTFGEVVLPSEEKIQNNLAGMLPDNWWSLNLPLKLLGKGIGSLHSPIDNSPGNFLLEQVAKRKQCRHQNAWS